MFAFQRDGSQLPEEIFLDGTSSASQRGEKGFIITKKKKCFKKIVCRTEGGALVTFWLEQIVNPFGNIEFYQASIWGGRRGAGGILGR